MKLIKQNRRVWVLAAALAVLGGIVAWRLSATAQAHRDRGLALSRFHRAERRHRPGLGPLRIQPGGPMLGALCFIARAGIEGSRVRLVPLYSPHLVLRGCSEQPCIVLIGRDARAIEIGAGYHQALPGKLPPFARCRLRELPPGWAVPLGR